MAAGEAGAAAEWVEAADADMAADAIIERQGRVFTRLMRQDRATGGRVAQRRRFDGNEAVAEGETRSGVLLFSRC